MALPGNRNRLEVVTGPITSKHMTPEQCEKLLEMDVARIYRRTPTTETIQTCVASIHGKQGPELKQPFAWN